MVIDRSNPGTIITHARLAIKYKLYNTPSSNWQLKSLLSDIVNGAKNYQVDLAFVDEQPKGVLVFDYISGNIQVFVKHSHRNLGIGTLLVSPYSRYESYGSYGIQNVEDWWKKRGFKVY